MDSSSYLTVLTIVAGLSSVLSLIASPPILKKYCAEQIKIDVSVRQMRKAEDRIANFLAKNNLSSNSSIDHIAHTLRIVDGEIASDGSSGARLCTPDKNGNLTVSFRRGLSKEDRLFNLAHECAHQINGDEPPNTRPIGRNKSKVEQIADYTAAALMMPISEVHDFLTLNDYASADKNKRYALIKKLCKTYSVSEIIALRRVHEINELKNMKMKL